MSWRRIARLAVSFLVTPASLLGVAEGAAAAEALKVKVVLDDVAVERIAPSTLRGLQQRLRVELDVVHEASAAPLEAVDSTPVVRVWIRFHPEGAELSVRDEAQQRVFRRSFTESNDKEGQARAREAVLAVLASTLDALRHGEIIGEPAPLEMTPVLTPAPESPRFTPEERPGSSPEAPEPTPKLPPATSLASRLAVGYAVGTWGSRVAHGPTASLGVAAPLGAARELFADGSVSWSVPRATRAEDIDTTLTALRPRLWGGVRQALSRSTSIGAYAGGGVDASWTSTDGAARWQVRPSTRHVRGVFSLGLSARIQTRAGWPSALLRVGIDLDPDPLLLEVREGSRRYVVDDAGHLRLDTALCIGVP